MFHWLVAFAEQGRRAPAQAATGDGLQQQASLLPAAIAGTADAPQPDEADAAQSPAAEQPPSVCGAVGFAWNSGV